MLSRGLSGFTFLYPRPALGFYRLDKPKSWRYPAKTVETLVLVFGDIGTLFPTVYKEEGGENSNIRGGQNRDCVNPHGR